MGPTKPDLCWQRDNPVVDEERQSDLIRERLSVQLDEFGSVDDDTYDPEVFGSIIPRCHC